MMKREGGNCTIPPLHFHILSEIRGNFLDFWGIFEQDLKYCRIRIGVIPCRLGIQRKMAQAQQIRSMNRESEILRKKVHNRE
jgi:hypothetical protein